MTADPDDDEAIGVYGDDPLGIMSTGPADPPSYYRYPDPAPCTCKPPGRWALYVKHGARELDPDHECTEPRPGIDWHEVFTGLAVWRRT